MAQRIGIYSGTFDPVHVGHVAFASRTLLDCNLDKILFVPEAMPRGKVHVTSNTHRIALLQSALEGIDSMEVIRLSSQQFSVLETLPELRTLVGDAKLTLLVGSDIVCGSLRLWPDLELLLQNVSLAIGLRTMHSISEVTTAIQNIKKECTSPIEYNIIETQYADLTSTLIRNNQHHSSHVHFKTAQYIRENGLYSR